MICKCMANVPSSEYVEVGPGRYVFIEQGYLAATHHTGCFLFFRNAMVVQQGIALEVRLPGAQQVARSCGGEPLQLASPDGSRGSPVPVNEHLRPGRQWPGALFLDDRNEDTFPAGLLKFQ